MKTKHSLKEKESESAVCADCGKEDCCCEESCGCDASCGPSGYGANCGCGPCSGGYGQHKKWLGLGLILLGILWYLKNTNVIPAQYFWPIVFVVAGVGLLSKGYFMRHG